MGHHYLPRRLLRGFSQEGKIWTFDKKSGDDPKNLPIARIAQEPAMYSEEVEVRLNNEIEQPFNSILDRLDGGERIHKQDIGVIVRYVLTMYRRVPSGRARTFAAVPDVMNQVEAEQFRRIDLLEQLDPSASSLALRGRENLSEIFARLRSGKKDWLWHDTLFPERFSRLIELLENMEWQYLGIPSGTQMLMGDRPVLMDEKNGLINGRAEIVFPIRHDALLVACWRKKDQRRSQRMSLERVRFVNSLIVSMADRWVFCRKNEAWVASFVRKHSI